MQNKEIEIKLKLTKEKAEELEKFLHENAEFKGEVRQKDQYYQPKGKSYIEEDGGIYQWLRIREQAGKVILCYKFVHKEEEGGRRNKDEYETQVSSAEQMRQILAATGFEELVLIDKRRKIYIYKDEYEIVLDYIAGLGYFTEIEFKAQADSVNEANDKIEKIAEELGLDVKDENLIGYAHMMLIKEKGARRPDFVSEEQLKKYLS